MIGGALAAAGVAVLLHLPWALGLLGPDTTLSSFTGVPRTDQVSDLAALLRFEVGPLGSAPAGVVLRHRGRAAPADRAGGAPRLGRARLDPGGGLLRGRVGRAAGGPARGAPGRRRAARAGGRRAGAGHRDGRPGLRGGPAGLPVRVAAGRVGGGGRGRRRRDRARSLGASFDGRWSMPAGDDTRALGFIDAENDETPVPRALAGRPGGRARSAGWALEDGLVYGTTDDGAPTLENLWVGSDDGPSALLADALDMASTGQTARLGRLLAPMGVRYVVVPEGLAPEPFARPDLPVPPAVRATLEAQLDLEPVDVPAGLTVYRNEAFMPTAGGRARVRRDPRGRGHRRARSASTCPARPRSSRTPRDGSAGPVRSRTTPPCCSRPRAPTDGSWRSMAPRSNGSSRSSGATGFEVTEGGSGRPQLPHLAVGCYVALAHPDRRLALGAAHRGVAPARPAGRHERGGRVRSSRLTALVLIGAVVVGGLVLDAADEPTAAPASTNPPVVAGVAMPAANPASTLSSTWYCAARHRATEGAGRPRAPDPQPHGHGPHGHDHRAPGHVATPPSGR